MAEIKDIVFDCARAAPLARFWSAALEGYEVMPYDDEELARLAAVGKTPETDPNVIVVGPGPRLCFQEVPEPKTVKNRVHLDVNAGDRGAEVERLCLLGATVSEVYDDWTRMADPEGNEFCVFEGGSGE
jgi:hypothetical protein